MQRDLQFLLDMLQSAELILTYETTRQTLPNISWSEINGMRNRLVHGYDDVNLNIVWDVVQSEIP
jgi:uncharacterized protein with HEPN domain